MWLTPGRGLVLFDTSAAKREEIDLHEIVELRASVRSEQLEREWRWREYGSDVKVETGRAYPRRWLNHTAALADGRRLECRLQGTVLYFEAESPAAPEREQAAGPATAAAARDKPAPVARRFILRQYERGETGQTLDDLVYVRAVIVHEKGKAPADAQAHAPVEPPRPAAPSPEASGDGGASRGADQ